MIISSDGLSLTADATRNMLKLQGKLSFRFYMMII
jgi:hypothetical protein